VGDSGTIIRTIDAGANWEQVPVNTNLPLKSACFIGDTGWAAGGGINDSSGQTNSVILRTLDRGKNWTVQQYNSPGYLQDIFFIDRYNGWAAGNGSYSRIIKTEDGGETWTPVEIDCGSHLNKIYFTGLQNGAAAGKSGKIFVTNNGGRNWMPLQFPSSADIKDYYFLSANSSLVLANGIFTASGNCKEWNTNYLDGNADFNAVTFASDKIGWIAGNDGLILKTSTGGQLEEDCRPGDIVLPQEFQLLQNYPNPFNSKTIINYSLGKQLSALSNVELAIYNILGQKVKTLVNKKQQPGSYSVSFDGSGLASGVYICRLKAGSGFIKCRKLILLK
jgi:photosystem II stability/assembly factor-like uncharacterized protein